MMSSKQCLRDSSLSEDVQKRYRYQFVAYKMQYTSVTNSANQRGHTLKLIIYTQRQQVSATLHQRTSHV